MTEKNSRKNETVDALFDAILSLESREECYAFFEDLCTVKEISDMAQRLEAAKLLLGGQAEGAGTMKKQLNIKKLILLNLPYILMGLFSTNFGEAWRMAVGADASAKMLSFFSTLPVALASWWPSLHPLDLLVGLCCGGGLRLAVYLKSKNAKKYRHGMEYGSARWSA